MIAIATADFLPNLDPDDAPLLEALDGRAEVKVWNDPEVDWASYDAVLLRSVWDYFLKYDEFIPWVESVPVPMWNPADTVVWNSRKDYLRELADRGVRTIPTAWEGEVEWDDAIIKPTVAGGSLGLRRASAGDPIGENEMAQPFLPEILEGELSLIFFDGQFSHAIRKTPKEGDIRVQPEWGGIVTKANPSEAELEAAHGVIEATGRDLLYARVDFVADRLLIELEAIEPRFFLEYAPGAEQRLVEALLRRTAP